MIIFANVNANKKHKITSEKDFRLGDHSSNKRHYLVLNTERSHTAANIQLIRGKLIREGASLSSTDRAAQGGNDHPFI